MNHIIFQENPNNKYKIAILIKSSSFKSPGLKTNYIEPLTTLGLNPMDIIGFDLKYNEKGKCPVKLIKEYLGNLLKALDSIGTETLLVADSAYFKTLTKVRKVEPHFGYILPCAIPGYEHINVILTINYQALFYNPDLQKKLTISLNTLVNHINGTHVDLGTSIIHSESYPETLSNISDALDNLHQYDVLTCDIETFSLNFHEAGIGTIAFAWDQHNSLAFCVDYESNKHPPVDGWYGHQINNKPIKELLLKFFLSYKGKLIYQGATFDVKILIYELFMKDLLDTPGLIDGLDCLYENIDDTKIITYLATNTTAGNKLGLKENAFEFAGNYAQDDIKDIRRIPEQELLRYNLVDCLSTWYVHNKNLPIMIQDEQEEVYNEIMLPSLRVITQMELTGMPLDMKEVHKVKGELSDILWIYEDIIKSSPLIIEFEDQMRKEEMITKNLLLKKKVKPLNDFIDSEYNPGSPKQTAKLLHEEFGFDIIDTTDTGLPSTGAKTIKKHLNKLMNEFNITEEELEQ